MVTTGEKQKLHKVEQPILRIDPLFHQDIEPQELENEIQNPHSDKFRAPRDDGITNRMIQAGGPKFEEILHEVFGTLWQHDPTKGMVDVTDAANLQGWGQTNGRTSVISWHLFE